MDGDLCTANAIAGDENHFQTQIRFHRVMYSDPIYQEAVKRFAGLFDLAQTTDLKEPTAMTLATVGENGQPSVRIVLLRCADERGFVFFTNSLSRKGIQIASNPHAALGLFWDSLGEQVCVEGVASPVGDAESGIYWKSRPRGSQVGAWASLQSEELPTRTMLDQRVEDFEKKFANREVSRPEHWYGYRIAPVRIEFWQEGVSRLHTRTVYELREDEWVRFSLYP